MGRNLFIPAIVTEKLFGDPEILFGRDAGGVVGFCGEEGCKR